MSIQFVTALPGHGKGVFNMHELGRKLETSDRRQITTMTEILPDKLGQFIRKRNPERIIDMDRRLYFIPKKDTHQFYRYRGSFTLPEPPVLRKDMPDSEKDAACVEYFKPLTEPGAQGIDYLLTEAHRHFRSEGWDSMSYIVMWYLTQHRHFDDNVVVETQLPGQVVVQMRRLADECVQLQNDYKRKIWGFKRPGCFKVKRFYRVPTTESAEPYETGSFKLDPDGWAGCYRTRGAVAEGTGSPETDTSKKAPPFWMLVGLGSLGILAVLGGIMLVPKLVGKGIGAFIGSTQSAITSEVTKATGLEDKSSHVRTEAKSGAKPHPEGANGGQARLDDAGAGKPPEKPYATGFLKGPKGVTVVLSDGSRVSTQRGIIDEIGIQGKTYPLRPKTTETKPAPEPQPPPRSGEKIWVPQPVKKL